MYPKHWYPFTRKETASHFGAVYWRSLQWQCQISQCLTLPSVTNANYYLMWNIGISLSDCCGSDWKHWKRERGKCRGKTYDAHSRLSTFVDLHVRDFDVSWYPISLLLFRTLVIASDESGLHHVAGDLVFPAFLLLRRPAESNKLFKRVHFFILYRHWLHIYLCMYFMLPKSVLLKTNFQLCTHFDVILYLYNSRLLSSLGQLDVLWLKCVSMFVVPKFVNF